MSDSESRLSLFVTEAVQMKRLKIRWKITCSLTHQSGAHTALSVPKFLSINRQPPYILDLLPEEILVLPKFRFSLKGRQIEAVHIVQIRNLGQQM
jgi:hypothetical protein